MADSFTNNYNLVLQVTGSNPGTWGTDVNNNLTSPLDAALGGTQSLVMSGSNVTLTLAQWQNKAFKITGTLTANVSLILPLSPNAIGGTPAVGGEFIVFNQTTGNFTLNVLTAATGSTGTTVPQGATSILYSDTINVVRADSAAAPPIGTVLDYAGSTAPGSGWLLCFGQSLLRAQYVALFTVIGTTYGAVDGTHFNVPDCRGYAVAGLDNMGGVAANRIGTVVTDSGTIVGTTLGSTGGSSTHAQIQAELALHTHVDSGHAHPLNDSSGAGGVVTGSTGNIRNPGGANGGNFTTLSVGTGNANIQNTGSGQAMAWLQPTIMMNKIIFAGA